MNFATKTKGALRSRVTAAALAGVVATLSLSALSAGAASNPGFILYSAQGYDSTMVKAFNATHPGFTVTLNDNSTGPLLQQIQAEGTNPKWGVLWVDGATPFAALDLKGMLVKNSVPKVSFNALGKANIPADGSFTPASVTVTGALCYDSAQVSASQLPSTLAQLTQAQYQGLGMNDPSQSGPTYPLIASYMAFLGHYKSGSTAKAVATGKSFFTTLYQNGLTVNATNGPTVAAMQSQQIKMAIIQSSACYGHQLSDYPSMRVKYLDASAQLPGVIGIDAKMPAVVRADGQKFVDYVMSAAGQRVMQGDWTKTQDGDSLFWPVLNGEKPVVSIIPPITSTHSIAINPYVWGPLENSINAWFDANIAQG